MREELCMMTETDQKQRDAEMNAGIDLPREKGIRPMRLTEAADAFDSKEYLFELIRNGIRCVAYLDENETELRSARNMLLSPLFPELSNLHVAAMKPCVIDGFIVHAEDAWESIHSRMYTTLPHAIQKAAAIWPAKMVAHDILYCDGQPMSHRKFCQRRAILTDNINDRMNISISHAIDELGKAFYMLAEENGWDGILAKRKDGLYISGESPVDWLYIPVMRRAAFCPAV